ncbi:hypothetical protein LTR65_010087 [Meristemomyces frigidus]
MPGCVHDHKHSPWPSAGPLVICPGERTCGYCVGDDAKVDHGLAVNLRRHAYKEHTDGGKMDYGGVEVMLYGPWKKNKKAGVDPRRDDPGRDGLSPDADESDEESEFNRATPEATTLAPPDGMTDVEGPADRTVEAAMSQIPIRTRWKSQAGIRSAAEKARQKRINLKLKGSKQLELIHPTAAQQ